MPGDETAFWKGWQGYRVFLLRVLVGAAVWWVLSGGAAESWMVGGPAVLIAALLSSAMLPPLRMSAAGLPAYLTFFVRESLLGGVDVARRAFHWRLPLDPGIVRHRLRLTRPLARVSLVNTSSLLPGTLIVDLDDAWTYVHALDRSRRIDEGITQCEHRVARLFGQSRLDVDDRPPEPGR